MFGVDDALICMALALAIAQAGVFLKFVVLTHQGDHIWNIPPPTVEENVEATKWNMAQQLIYNPILCIVKASILVFLLRLGDSRMSIYWTLQGLRWFNLGHMIATFFGALTQCLPIHMYWDHFYTDQTMPDGTVVNPNYKCFNMAAFSLITAGIAILTDILILLVPVAMMWNLRMPLRQKFAVGAVLSFGWIVAIIGIVRLKAFYDFWYPSAVGEDSTYNVTITLSGIEVNVAIITACGPMLKALVARFAPRLFSAKSSPRSITKPYLSRGYELNSAAGTTKKGRPRSHAHPGITTVLEDHDDHGESQEHIVRDSHFFMDDKSEQTAVEEEITTCPPDKMAPTDSDIGRAA